MVQIGGKSAPPGSVVPNVNPLKLALAFSWCTVHPWGARNTTGAAVFVLNPERLNAVTHVNSLKCTSSFPIDPMYGGDIKWRQCFGWTPPAVRLCWIGSLWLLNSTERALHRTSWAPSFALILSAKPTGQLWHPVTTDENSIHLHLDLVLTFRAFRRGFYPKHLTIVYTRIQKSQAGKYYTHLYIYTRINNSKL